MEEETKETTFVEKQLEDAIAEISNLKNALKLERANFLNYQQRMKKDMAIVEEQCLRGYMTEMLPILDSFDLSLKSKPSGQNDVFSVNEMIMCSLTQILSVRGLERIEDTKIVDPLRHEVIINNGKEIVETFRSGYLWNGKVLRPAQVRTA